MFQIKIPFRLVEKLFNPANKGIIKVVKAPGCNNTYSLIMPPYPQMYLMEPLKNMNS